MARDLKVVDRGIAADERDTAADVRDIKADLRDHMADKRERTADARDNTAEQAAKANHATRSVAAHRVLNSAAAVLGGINLLQIGQGTVPDPDTAALLDRMDAHARIVSDCLRELVGGQSATSA